MNTGLLGALSRYIPYTGQVNGECWPVDPPGGWNAGLTAPAPCVGGNAVESRGQLDAGWLAATVLPYSTPSVNDPFKGIVSEDLNMGLIIKQLLLVPLDVIWDDFKF